MENKKTLDKGREAFRLEEWEDAYIKLSSTDQVNPLDPGDLEILAISAYLTGRFTKSNDIWTRAHSDYLKENNIRGAVRSAFWLGFSLLNKGEYARGGGWIGRARSFLDENQLDCVEHGYLLIPKALQQLGQGDINDAIALFDKAGKIAARFQDIDLITLSKLGRGQALIRNGDIQQGVLFLDEAMANVESGNHSPIVVGIVYCAVIETCLEIFDLSRAHEWTEALSDWCKSHPYLIPFRGQCLIRRSEILQLHGEWTEAIDEVNHAIKILSGYGGEPAAGAAYYQMGELYRLYGEYNKAEEAYREANKWGKKPQPGLALLRLAQGQTDSAIFSIDNALRDTGDHKNRNRILSAYSEIMLVAGEITKARNAADELMENSRKHDIPFIKAMSLETDGAVLLAEGDPYKALDKLFDAKNIWEQIKVPYYSARTRTLIAQACTDTGDKDTAMLELKTAQWIFERIQAKPDLKRIELLLNNIRAVKKNPLSGREQEVLKLIVRGSTNKAIAEKLFISERTVERHVSNIFNKLNVSTRAEATSYAYQHQLI